jgi:hypothetical protein
MCISIALKSLDIPFSWYDEAYVNFSGGKQATINYEKSASVKRGENQELLDDWTAWRLQIAIDDGELEVPEGVVLAWEWQHAGTPWLDPLKEAVGNIASVGASLESPITIVEETTGRPAREIIRDKAEFIRMHQEEGVPLPSWAVDTTSAMADDKPEDPPPGKAPEKNPKKSGARKPSTDGYDAAMRLALATPDDPLSRRINGNGVHHG